MADSTTDPVDLDRSTLETDGDLAGTLERVSFEAGIMLGAEALDAEQDYHRRRLNRHQRWLGGCGTVFGLAVDLPSGRTRADRTPDIQLVVSPGYAIDGLGRELLVPESYSISLLDWLASQRADDPGSLTSVFAGGVLFLRVTARGQALAAGLQPTLAPVFDAAIDPVVPSRVADSFLLELRPDPARTGDAAAGPFAAWSANRQPPAAADVPGPLAPREAATIAALDAVGQRELQLQSWLMRRGLPDQPSGPGKDELLNEAARILLCSVHVALANPSATPVFANVSINNLVRPFLRPNALLSGITLP